MKKFSSLIIVTIIIMVMSIVIYFPLAAGSSVPVKDTSANVSIPDSISKIFVRSCYSCHSDDGKGMGKSRVNFSKWDSYKPEKRSDKANDICTEMTEGSMPPKGFRKANPDAVPSPDETDKVCKWAKSLKQ